MKRQLTMKNLTSRQLNERREVIEKKLDEHYKANKEKIERYLELVNELSTLTVQANKAFLKENVPL